MAGSKPRQVILHTDASQKKQHYSLSWHAQVYRVDGELVTTHQGVAYREDAGNQRRTVPELELAAIGKGVSFFQKKYSTVRHMVIYTDNLEVLNAMRKPYLPTAKKLQPEVLRIKKLLKKMGCSWKIRKINRARNKADEIGTLRGKSIAEIEQLIDNVAEKQVGIQTHVYVDIGCLTNASGGMDRQALELLQRISERAYRSNLYFVGIREQSYLVKVVSAFRLNALLAKSPDSIDFLHGKSLNDHFIFFSKNKGRVMSYLKMGGSAFLLGRGISLKEKEAKHTNLQVIKSWSSFEKILLESLEIAQ